MSRSPPPTTISSSSICTWTPSTAGRSGMGGRSGPGWHPMPVTTIVVENSITPSSVPSQVALHPEIAMRGQREVPGRAHRGADPTVASVGGGAAWHGAVSLVAVARSGAARTPTRRTLRPPARTGRTPTERPSESCSNAATSSPATVTVTVPASTATSSTPATAWAASRAPGASVTRASPAATRSGASRYTDSPPAPAS